MRIRLGGLAGSVNVFAVALGLSLAVLPASAQIPSPPGATPPPPTPNMPTSAEAQKLHGIAAPPFAAASDKLPLAQLKLPPGFKIEVYASGVTNARSLRLGDKGTLFVGNLARDKVYAIVDRDGKREVKVIASGLDRPNGLAFKNGTLYIAEGTKISKLENIENNLDNPPKPVVIYSDLPNHVSRLEVSDDRPRQPALCQCRRAVQHLHAAAGKCPAAQHRARRQRRESRRPRHPPGRRHGLQPRQQGAVLHRKPARLAVRGRAAGQAQPAPASGHGQFRLSVLRRRRHRRSDLRLGPQLQRIHQAGRAARAALGAARHALLHGSDVSGKIPRRDLSGAPRLLEQDAQDRRRPRRRLSEQGRHGESAGAVSDRLPAGQHLYRPAGRRAADEGRLAAGL